MDDSINEISYIFPDFKVLNIIKTGKEAIVYLCSANGKLMALKQFKENTKFSTRFEYMNFASMKRRNRIAIQKKTKAGNRMSQGIWTYTEYSVLEQLFELGADVVKPYHMTHNTILMEYVGDFKSPAKRLTDTKLNTELAFNIYDKVIYNISLFLDVGIVHGDLSEFNILFFNNDIKIIDFPQAIYIKENINGKRQLERDIDNVNKYFSKYLHTQYLKDAKEYLLNEYSNIIN